VLPVFIATFASFHRVHCVRLLLFLRRERLNW
jgi:hypothetical protein